MINQPDMTQEAFHELQLLESCRLRAYRDTGGVLTVGWAHTSAAGPPRVTEGMEISQEMADAIFRRDLQSTKRDVERALSVPVNANVMSALMMFTYNLGATKARRSGVSREINGGNIEKAAKIMLKLVHDKKGKVQGGLVRRRAIEVSIMTAHIHTANDTRAPSRYQSKVRKPSSTVSHASMAASGAGIIGLYQHYPTLAYAVVAAAVAVGGWVLYRRLTKDG